MKRQAPVLDRDALTAEIAGLSKASITDLRERWKTLYGKEPSGHIGRSFLIRAIAYRLQKRLSAVSSPRPDACSRGSPKRLRLGARRRARRFERRKRERFWSANGKGPRIG